MTSRAMVTLEIMSADRSMLRLFGAKPANIYCIFCGIICYLVRRLLNAEYDRPCSAVAKFTLTSIQA